MEQLQSHIWLTTSSYMEKYLRISSDIRKPFLTCMTLQLLHSEFLYICMRKILLYFLSVHVHCTVVQYLTKRASGGTSVEMPWKTETNSSCQVALWSEYPTPFPDSGLHLGHLCEAVGTRPVFCTLYAWSLLNRHRFNLGHLFRQCTRQVYWT